MFAPRYARPSNQTGSVMQSPPGSAWDYTPSGSLDGARPDVAPSASFYGVTWGHNGEPFYMIPSSNGMVLPPAPHQLLPLAAIVRVILANLGLGY